MNHVYTPFRRRTARSPWECIPSGLNPQSSQFRPQPLVVPGYTAVAAVSIRPLIECQDARQRLARPSGVNR